MLRCRRVAEPRRFVGIQIAQGAETAFVVLTFRARVDECALVAREGIFVLVILDEVLPHLRTEVLEQKSQMTRERIIAQHGMARLGEIAQAEQEEREQNQRHPR